MVRASVTPAHEPLLVSASGRSRKAGVSGTVLDDLSGTYKTFAEAVKELISNAFDADATKVHLRFRNAYGELEVTDDGAGMSPKQVVEEYIRVGRSVDSKRWSPNGSRERIGGKGIGSIAPSRYCKRLSVRTKTKMPMTDTVSVRVNETGRVLLETVFPYCALEDWTLPLFTSMEYSVEGNEGSEPLEPGLVVQLPPGRLCRVTYTFAANKVWLIGRIDFMKLRQMGEHINLEQVADLWDLSLNRADESSWPTSGTSVVMEGLEEFVTNDLKVPGKPHARNIASKSGLERFLWNLSRLSPVSVSSPKGEVAEKFPTPVTQLLLGGDSLRVFVSQENESLVQLQREVYIPHRPLSGNDASLCRTVSFSDPKLGLSVEGYVIGSSTIIYPAELRGISLRVRGVELGTPNLFGAEKLVSGPQYSALTNHITGELRLEGVDVRRDILPGREGLYPESPVYRAIRTTMVGADDRFVGVLKDLVNEVLLRSDASSSAQALIKRLDAQRKALLDAASAIATMSEVDECLVERLMSPAEGDLQLLLDDDVEIRPEGRLAAYSIEYSDSLRVSEVEVDFSGRRVILPRGAPYLQRSLDIAGICFTVLFKQSTNKRVFCEVDPENRNIFINWDHPVRSAMGDSAYIKHCLAAVVCEIPQLALNRYMQLISSRS